MCLANQISGIFDRKWSFNLGTVRKFRTQYTADFLHPFHPLGVRNDFSYLSLKNTSYTKIVEGDEVTYGSSNGLFNLGAIQLDLGRVMNGEITLETFCEGLLQDQWELILASRDAAEEKAVAFLAKSEVAATAVADDGGEDLVDDGDDFEVGDDAGVVEDDVVDATGDDV